MKREVWLGVLRGQQGSEEEEEDKRVKRPGREELQGWREWRRNHLYGGSMDVNPVQLCLHCLLLFTLHSECDSIWRGRVLFPSSNQRSALPELTNRSQIWVK